MAESFPVTTAEIREKLFDDMCELGQRYLYDGDVEKALRWLNSAADLGSERANFELGEIYYYGKKVPEDEPKAAEYFEKSEDFSDDEICCCFGDMYRYGKGVEKNIEKAILWYEHGEVLGNRDATSALAEIYRDGEGGIKPDSEKTVHYLMELAFNSGDYFFATDTEIYGDGQDVPMSYSEKDYWLSFDCSQGDDEAKFELGCMYLYGRGVKRDIYKAAWWFAKMNELDLYDNGEVFDLAECYRKGDGVKKNIDAAIAWYEKLVEWRHDCHEEALFALAEIYFHGDGVEQDIDMALGYYEQAADCGNVRAAYKLAKIYRDGDGIEKDIETALDYYERAARRIATQMG